MADGIDERDHAAEAAAGLDRARDHIDAAAAADLTTPFAGSRPGRRRPHARSRRGAVRRRTGAGRPPDVRELLAAAPVNLEVVLTGGHQQSDYLADHADLVTNVRKETHLIDAGQGAGRGTAYRAVVVETRRQTAV